jgi:rod shape-determining protein MreC
MLRRFIITGLVILLFFFGLSRFLGLGEGRLEQAMAVIAYPVVKAQYKLRQAFGLDSASQQARRANSALLKDLELSLEEREKLQKELLDLKAYLRYAENTKEIRAFLERYKTDKACIAQVLMRNVEGHQWFLVDAGAKQGVKVGSIAVYRDCLVGRVIEVYPSYSKLLLISDPACKVAAVCAETGTKGIHEGMGNPDRTALGYVDPLKLVKGDDLILSSGDGFVFPAGYALGTIKHVDNDGHSYTISVEPCAKLRTIQYCCIIPHGVEMNPEPEQAPQEEKESAHHSDVPITKSENQPA